MRREWWRTKHDEIVAPRLRAMQQLPRAGAGVVTTSVVVATVLGVLPVAFVVATSVMLGRVPAAVQGGVGSDAWTDLVVAFAIASGCFAAQQLLAPLQVALGELIIRRVDGRLVDDVLASSLGTKTLGPLEDQELLDHLSEITRSLDQNWFTPGGACAGIVALVARYVQLAGLTVIVGVAFSWWAAASVFVVTMAYRYAQRGGMRKYGKLWDSNARDRREGEYLRDLGIGDRAAKELRVFGLVDWVRERLRAVHFGWVMPVWRERRRLYLWPFLSISAVGLVVLAAVLGAVAAATARGELSLAEFALAVTGTLGAVGLGVYFPDADVQTQFGTLALGNLNSFVEGIRTHPAEVVAASAATAGTSPAPVGEVPRSAVRFEDVSFHYPGADELVLDHLDLEIPAGQATAIVGLNGAGKTTLVKLLGRLYEPASGRISVDGTDLRDLDLDGWRARIGIVFQDFNRYELTAADNIGWGAVGAAGDRDAIRRAADRAGILPALERLPRGLDSPLSRQYPDGADLSGGQWQRVAIARALLAVEGGSTVLVLDEPTASLDVRAEAAFFDRFVELTRGLTTILISHRFSSVRRADHIVVLSGGRVTEDGTHDELLAADGDYARLFRIQAERFVADAAAGEPAFEEVPAP